MEREFCVEKIDASGALKKLELQYPRNFNFGYDVVDVIAARTPQKKALVWCNAEGEEHIFTFEDIRRFSNRMAHVFQKAGSTWLLSKKRGFKGATASWWC